MGVPRISPKKPLSLHNTHPNLEKSKEPEAESLHPLKEGREDKNRSQQANN